MAEKKVEFEIKVKVKQADKRKRLPPPISNFLMAVSIF